eukprot:1010977-Alexandrium_andersonii.AAC.1
MSAGEGRDDGVSMTPSVGQQGRKSGLSAFKPEGVQAASGGHRCCRKSGKAMSVTRLDGGA